MAPMWAEVGPRGRWPAIWADKESPRLNPGRVGAQSGLGPGPGWGPNGPLWAHMRSLWAHMGPYGSSWTGLGRSGHVQFPTFGSISHVAGPKFGF